MKGKRTGVNTEAEGSRDGDRWERESEMKKKGQLESSHGQR